MKNLLCRLIFAALIVAAAQLCSVSVVAQSYPLVCRGDKGAVIKDDGPPQGVSLKFKKGSAAAASGLAPGECSWQDRGLNAAEPDILVQPTRQLRADEAVSAEYKWIDDLKDPDKYWTFEVYNDRKGQLIVSGSHKGNAADSGGLLLLGGSNSGGVLLLGGSNKPPEETKKTVTVATPLGEGIDIEAFAKAPKAPLYSLVKQFGGGVFSTGPYDCFYTASVEEKGYAGGLGFSFTGVVGYVLKTQLPGTVPLHRLFKDHDHFLTTDEEEKGFAKGLGYAYEGVLGYVSKMPLPGTKPLYRVFSKTHCYDTLESFRTNKNFEKVEAYVWTSP